MNFEIRFVDWDEYFRGMGLTAGEMLDYFKAAVELERYNPIPADTLGYDKANKVLYVARARLGR